MNLQSLSPILTVGEGTVLEPQVLRLEGKAVVEDGTSKQLYTLDRDIIASPMEASSSVLSKIEDELPGKDEDSSSPSTESRQLFYLVHPKNAQYRKDLPPYYLTAVTRESLGNIILNQARTLLQNREFTALVSMAKTASDDPLFDTSAQRVLFTAKPRWNRGGLKWIDADGREVAIEGPKNESPRLHVTARFSQCERDALVGLWVLRLWCEVAESRPIKKQGELSCKERVDAALLTWSSFGGLDSRNRSFGVSFGEAG